MAQGRGKIVGEVLVVVASVLGLGGCAGVARLPAGGLPSAALAIPAGNPAEADIAAGYRLYKETLERWGRWSKDPLYAVRWCPRGVDPARFVPFQSEGRWAQTSDMSAQTWGAPPGTPFWQSDDADTWGDITMHHGWWVHLDQSTPAGVWCWIPGAEETAARVVWREADGFVAWAPEPPMYDDQDDADFDVIPWAFELLGTLFERDLDGALLHDDAAAAAEHATWEAHHARTPSAIATGPRRMGPAAAQVKEARGALSGYVSAHPVVTPPSTGRTVAHATLPGSAPASVSGSASVPASGSVSGSASASGSVSVPASGTASVSGSATKTVSVSTEEPLPPAMLLYTQMMHDPFAGAGPNVGPGLGLPRSPYLAFLGTAAHGPGVPGIAAPAAAGTGRAYTTESTPTHARAGGHSGSHSHGSSGGSSGSSSGTTHSTSHK